MSEPAAEIYKFEYEVFVLFANIRTPAISTLTVAGEAVLAKGVPTSTLVVLDHSRLTVSWVMPNLPARNKPNSKSGLDENSRLNLIALHTLLPARASKNCILLPMEELRSGRIDIDS